MSRQHSLFLALAIVCGSALFLSNSAQSQLGVAKNYVQVQASAPGTAQAGHSNISGTARAGEFIGGGSGLTGLNAGALASGTVPDGVLSGNVARRDQSNAFNSGPNTFSGFLGVGRSFQVTGSESFGIGNNSTAFDGMYVRTATQGLPFYGYSLGGAVSAFHYVDGYDQNKWKFYQGSGIALTVDTAGRVGLGTLSPQSRLEVRSSDTTAAGSFFNSNTGNESSGVFAESTSTTGNVFGGHFRSSSTGGAAVFGDSTATSGNTYGGRFRVNSPNGAAVFGESTATTFRHYGGRFIANSSSAVGVSGESASGIGVKAGGFIAFEGISNSPSGYGIYVEANGAGGIGGYFQSGSSNAVRAISYGAQPTIYGSTNISGTHAIVAQALSPFSTASAVMGINSSGSGVAVRADGNFVASGSKAFRIDHPQDPTNQYLLHYCAEGPEPKNIYDGDVVTDAQGWATITLPHYFESINKNPRIQLTVEDDSDEFIMVKSVGGVKNGQFRIRTSMPNVKVYWEVKAVRNDRWMQRHGAPVEVDKPDHVRGTYVHPELYDQPSSRGEHRHLTSTATASRARTR